MSEQVYWLSWTVSDDVPVMDMAEEWPDGMIGFLSGYGDDHDIWCGIVFAESAEAAWHKVLSCYASKSHGGIGERIEPTECGEGWEPSDRFVGGAEWLRDERAKRKEQ